MMFKFDVLTVGELKNLMAGLPDETPVQHWLGSGGGTDMRFAALEQTRSLLHVSGGRSLIVYAHASWEAVPNLPEGGTAPDDRGAG